jgi:rhodanese-related sulfurtransferase
VSNLQESIATTQGTLSRLTPTPVILKASTAYELKSRLQWGDRALTIIDVREPEIFNRGHIAGAVSVPFPRLTDLAKSALHRHRHIYIYGESDDRSLAAMQTLQGVGFTSVTQIIGGLAAWREIAGSTERKKNLSMVTKFSTANKYDIIR